MSEQISEFAEPQVSAGDSDCKICGLCIERWHDPDKEALENNLLLFNMIMQIHRLFGEELSWFPLLEEVNQLPPTENEDYKMVHIAQVWCLQHAPENSRPMVNDASSLIQPDQAKCAHPSCKRTASWEY